MNDGEVTPVEIARLAGVSRAAVSNWRRRHADFPEPIAGTVTNPRFSLADVEAWLRDRDKVDELPAEELAWQQIRGQATERELPAAVAAAGDFLLRGRSPTGRQPAGLTRALSTLAERRGARPAFDWLLTRMHEATRVPLVAPGTAQIMTALLPETVEEVYDPACGTGGLIAACAENHPAARYIGDDTDPALRHLAELRAGTLNARFRDGGMQQPIEPPLSADAVICCPPVLDREWTSADLAYDARWQYGVPPKAEPELAWVQHALANLRPGGRAVLQLPPAVAARPSGRRIRAELLRRGALRAVIGLTAGTVGQQPDRHLWVLDRPTADTSPDQLAIIEIGLDGDAAPQDLKTAVAAFGGMIGMLAEETAPDMPDTVATVRLSDLVVVMRMVRIIDLLDDAVDVSPSRRLHADAGQVDAATVQRLHRQIRDELDRLSALLPAFEAPDSATSAELPMISIADLVGAGTLTVTVRHLSAEHAGEPGPDTVPLWRARDVAAGARPKVHLPADRVPDDAVRLHTGDVVVPVVGHQLLARVVTEAEAGALLGAGIYLLRPDPAMLDPWFLAGFLERRGNAVTAGSRGTINRFDVRRAEIPRIPVERQARYAALLRRLAEFQHLLHRTADTGTLLSGSLIEALAAGTLLPPD